MNISKEKAIFTEGEYVIVNNNYTRGLQRGMIGMINVILDAKNDEQYVELVVPFKTDDGKALQRCLAVWSNSLEHLPDEAANCMDIQKINNDIMTVRGPHFEYYHRNKVIKETSTEHLIEELKSRNEFNEMEPTKIIFNDPATIVFWNDGDKTVVKCTKGQKFSEYYGYLAAMAKKIYGTNGVINRLIRDKRVYGDQHVTPESIINTGKEAKKESLTAPTLKLNIDSDDLRKVEKPHTLKGQDYDGLESVLGPSFEGDKDGDDIPDRITYQHDLGSGFCITFNKRRKANAFYCEVEDSIQKYKMYLLSDLYQKLRELNFDDSDAAYLFTEYGWTSMDGIHVQKLAPDRWRVIFPPAKYLKR